jgi:hypothetical protein
VLEARVFYRVSGSNSVSYIGTSDEKRESLLRLMRLHIQYIRALEDSERCRRACVTYLQNWFFYFYPERPDLVAESKALAAQLGGQLVTPRLPLKYAWMQPLLGRPAATHTHRKLATLTAKAISQWDRAMFWLESRHVESGRQP